MKNAITRTFIVLMLLCAVIITGSIFILAGPSRAESIQRIGEKFMLEPNEENLRRLLNAEADGESAFLKMALIGNAFATHTDLFRSTSESRLSDYERESIDTLIRHGSGVFEYYTSKKPKNFDAVFESATWLKSEAQQDASSNP